MPIVGVGVTTGDFANRLQDLPACLDRFEKLGVDSVELSLGAFDIVAAARVLPWRLTELKRICADRPFGYTVHGPIASRFTDRPHLQIQMDVCRAALDVSGEIGATAQVHHGGDIAHDVGPDEHKALLTMERDALAELAPHAAERGVTLCVETLFSDDKKWCASPIELAEQIRQVDHPAIRATIDFSHSAINAGQRGFDLMAELAVLAPLTGHLHIHDSFGLPRTFRAYTYGEAVNFGMGDLHLPPGWGAFDWDAFAALPWAAPMIGNLELSTRFETELDASVALVRRMIEISADAAEVRASKT